MTMNTLLVLLIVVGLGASGCSFSASSAASSDSSAGSSESSSRSSRSSSPESKETAYRDDVRDYTQAYAKSGGQFDAFQKRIGELAMRHDVTNWEDSLVTYEGVGEGLGRAQVSQVQVDAYKQNLGHGDAQKMNAIQEAYNAQK
jgi:hypothetical protein